MHLVLKSKNATGNWSMRRFQVAIEKILDANAAKFGVKMHADQNSGNHLHLIVSCGRRENFQKFLKAVTGLIAMLVLNGEAGKFWTQPAFTRIITGARDYHSMLKYLSKNLIEVAFGKAARTEFEAGEKDARKERLRERRRKTARV